MDVLYQLGDLTVSRLTEPAEKVSLIALFREVSREKGWESGSELEGYSESAIFLALLAGGTLAGGIELRRLDFRSWLPIYGIWPELALTPATAPAELVVLALTPEFRGEPRNLWTLCTEMWRLSRAEGFEHLYMEVPVANYRIYQRLGWSLKICGPTRQHWGESCYPCLVNVAAVEQAILAKVGSVPSLEFVVNQARRPTGSSTPSFVTDSCL